MKSSIFFLLILILGIKLSAQNNISDYELKSDIILTNVLINIPEGWEASYIDNMIIIEKKDSIWILNEDWLKNPREDKTIRNKRIVDKGEKTKSILKIFVEPKWSYEKTTEVIKTNSLLYNDLKLLPAKYNIESNAKIVRDGKSSEITYVPKTQDDKKRMFEYNKEKESIEKLIRKIPDMNSEKYSLFIMEYKGCTDDTHYVYPNEASIELFTVMNIFKELCNK